MWNSRSYCRVGCGIVVHTLGQEGVTEKILVWGGGGIFASC